MRTWITSWIVTLGIAATCAGCGADETRKAAETQTSVDAQPAIEAQTETATVDKSYDGWYMQRAGQGLFQACGEERQLRVTDSADLGERARKFGLQQDTPVYVRVRGTQSVSGDELDVSRVEQFGSDKPVRNCGMTGVVIEDPAPSES